VLRTAVVSVLVSKDSGVVTMAIDDGLAPDRALCQFKEGFVGDEDVATSQHDGINALPPPVTR
jgi:hypothetical protein